MQRQLPLAPCFLSCLTHLFLCWAAFRRSCTRCPQLGQEEAIFRREPRLFLAHMPETSPLEGWRLTWSWCLPSCIFRLRLIWRSRLSMSWDLYLQLLKTWVCPATPGWVSSNQGGRRWGRRLSCTGKKKKKLVEDFKTEQDFSSFNVVLRMLIALFLRSLRLLNSLVFLSYI